ncbi:VirE protein [Mediterranea massiliensis]|uniref:VirE protein n=1 Tax=Mediterranea massiliensis TaxID=1841865 RepID=A0ABS2E0C0_9BACT|nr:BT4734/BF3469 family protein [Mediterranea massiliensis]MBM6735087.1 VirE protein [Mediterranea massiliensis]
MKFGISNNIKSRVVRECTPELFHQAMRSELVAEVCAEIADGKEKCLRGELTKEEYDTLKAGLKKRLPIFTPHATFRNGRRLNADAVPSGLSMYDVDHLPNPRGYWEQKRAELEARGVMRYVVLAHITPSTEGLRLFFIIPAGMDLAEAQRWMSQQMGDANYDASVKDYARSSFVVPEGYVLYLDEEKLFNEELKIENGELPASTNPLVGTHHGASDDDANAADTPQADVAAPADTPHTDAPRCVPTFKGVPYSEIIGQWFRLAGGEPVQGERNDKLHRLASHLRYIADNDEALLLQVMPRYGLSEEEMRGLIHSACSAKWYSMPKMMRQALNNGEGKMENEKMPADDEENNSQLSILNSPLPKRLPALIKLLVSRTPDVYKAAVAHAVFPALGAHLHRVRFRYIDNVEHEATLMNVLMAGTGAGKDCISEPINRIMADIRRRDEDNLRREREWKNEVTSKGANKDKRQRPEGLIIQEIDADMTNPAFVMRMAEADGHFLYTKLNEIDQFDALKGTGRTGQQFQIMCLSFDPGNRYGQTRVGVQSVTEKVTIRFNWNASTTIQKGKRYFSRVLTDGPISRINFCTIPEREIGADMPVYGTYDAAFDEELRPYIDNLVKAQGLIDCPQAYKLAKTLKEECADFARLSQSRVYENLSFRANVIAYLKACVLYVANGCRWDKTFEEFIRWSLQYDLACKMEFFGADIEEAQAAGGARNKKGPRNLLELLPDNFSYREAVEVRLQAGMDEKGTQNMLNQWGYRNYIARITNYNYSKLKFRNDGTDTDKNY